MATQHINTSHSPCRRSTSQARRQETHRSKQQIKASHSRCRRSISQAPAQATHQRQQVKISQFPCRRCASLRHRINCVAANNKSKPAIPAVDARFRKHPLKKHISGSKSKQASSHVDAPFCNKTPHQRRRSKQHIKTSHSPCTRSTNSRHKWHHNISKLKERPRTALDHYRLDGRQHMMEVLKPSPNPAAHGVGTTSPRQGRLKLLNLLQVACEFAFARGDLVRASHMELRHDLTLRANSLVSPFNDEPVPRQQASPGQARWWPVGIDPGASLDLAGDDTHQRCCVFLALLDALTLRSLVQTSRVVPPQVRGGARVRGSGNSRVRTTGWCRGACGEYRRRADGVIDASSIQRDECGPWVQNNSCSQHRCQAVSAGSSLHRELKRSSGGSERATECACERSENEAPEHFPCGDARTPPVGLRRAVSHERTMASSAICGEVHNASPTWYVDRMTSPAGLNSRTSGAAARSSCAGHRAGSVMARNISASPGLAPRSTSRGLAKVPRLTLAADRGCCRGAPDCFREYTWGATGLDVCRAGSHQ